MVLSHPPSSTTPSMGLARNISSVDIAAMFRQSIAVGLTCVSPSETTGRPLYDPGDSNPLAVHDWSPGADYVAHVVRALAGADDPRLPELITWLELHREEKTGRVSAIGTDHELAFEALRSGELAARLSADREVMMAYLAAAKKDPAIAAAVDQAAVREAQAAEVHRGQCAGTSASRAPSSTGPSTHRRRYPPVRSATTQPKQAPKPHAMPDSSASWQATPSVAHRARTASSIGGGPHA